MRSRRPQRKVYPRTREEVRPAAEDPKGRHTQKHMKRKGQQQQKTPKEDIPKNTRRGKASSRRPKRKVYPRTCEEER